MQYNCFYTCGCNQLAAQVGPALGSDAEYVHHEAVPVSYYKCKQSETRASAKLFRLLVRGKSSLECT
eukprot:364003-Chlamydomonas_euryale.AAC.13